MSAYTQEQLDALRAALARGVTRLRLNNEEVQYASMAEMRQQIAIMERDLGQPVVTQHYPTFSRGT